VRRQENPPNAVGGFLGEWRVVGGTVDNPLWTDPPKAVGGLLGEGRRSATAHSSPPTRHTQLAATDTTNPNATGRDEGKLRWSGESWAQRPPLAVGERGR
jgi:hypothetical protein